MTPTDTLAPVTTPDVNLAPYSDEAFFAAMNSQPVLDALNKAVSDELERNASQTVSEVVTAAVATPTPSPITLTALPPTVATPFPWKSAGLGAAVGAGIALAAWGGYVLLNRRRAASLKKASPEAMKTHQPAAEAA